MVGPLQHLDFRIFDDFSGFFGLGFQVAMVLVCFKVELFIGFCQGQCHASGVLLGDIGFVGRPKTVGDFARSQRIGTV